MHLALGYPHACRERVKAVNAFVRAHKKGLVTSDLLNEAAAALNGANLHDPQQ